MAFLLRGFGGFGFEVKDFGLGVKGFLLGLCVRGAFFGCVGHLSDAQLRLNI